MTSFLRDERSSGILAHVTSLPSPYGIGDIGPSAVSFLDYLVAAGQRYWQILPTGPTNLIFDSSPYMSTSAFAGSPLLISPALLRSSGLINHRQLESHQAFSPYTTQYELVAEFKLRLLDHAFKEFSSTTTNTSFNTFKQETSWLEDYALFMALKDIYQGKPWFKWPQHIAKRNPSALSSARTRYKSLFEYYCFEQFIFYSQWADLKDQAEKRDLRLLGDIPIYIGLDSADVWSNQELFELDSVTLAPLNVSGVPPDYFSKTGQRWGNPLYRWKARDKQVRDNLVSWWVERFKAVFKRVDAARIDHFRGFESYWSIPAQEETAVRGQWKKGPGASFFKKIESRLGQLNIIAEDLGDITPAVIKLRDTLNFPGMKVLQFAFDNNPDNAFLPYNFSSPHCVIYTGTHDNDTTVGWFFSERLNEDMRSKVKKYANRSLNDNRGIHEDFIYLALSSSANLAILPLQDLLGFGNDCRMNTPGVPTGNWKWRCAEKFLTAERATWLREITTRFGR